MAKFTRHDPRNKKKNRNKKICLEKDFRIKHVEKKLESKLHYEEVQPQKDTVGV